jgi:uncharacterized protein (TIGR00369 family)
MADEFAEDAAGLVQAVIDAEHGYLSWLDTRVETVEPGRVVLRIPFDEKLTNPGSPPTIHGGVAATLIDTAGGLAQRSVLDDPYAGGVATVNLNVNYLRRATADLTATADVVRAGSTIGVSEIVVESGDEESEPVAVGQGAYRLFRE